MPLPMAWTKRCPGFNRCNYEVLFVEVLILKFSPHILFCFLALTLLAVTSAAQSAPDWRTPAELTDYRTTPNYAETLAYIDRVAAAAPTQVKVETFGETGEGRELKIVIVSKDGVFDPAAIHASGRVILLVQNSIHAGEMDGKDSCLALLRDLVITKSRERLLDHVVLVFIPVYNIDGHERRSAFNRINQNGPEEMGWRANGTNLNLNRDYMKADAPETRALLALINKLRPDFFVDNHVTDGADFQYDVTFSIDDSPDTPPATVEWVHTIAAPIAEAVNKTGHLAFPSYIDLVDESDPTKGIGFNDFSPRFSTNQLALNNRPAMLVEMHMLKDYKTRVTGNYELLVALMATLNQDATRLIALNAAADQAAAKISSQSTPYPLTFTWSGQSTPVLFHGYQFTREPSEISGATWIRYSHEPWDQTIPMQTGFKTALSIVPPAAYIIPRQWKQVISVLAAHGVEMKTLASEITTTAGRYNCSGFTWQQRPYEGHHPLFSAEYSHDANSKSASCQLTDEHVTIPAGSILVPLNQRLAQVAIHWLEPMAPDSALSWGFFDTIFEQKEYGEGYVLEKLARTMLAKDPALKAEFEARLKSDPKFAANPRARLSFFYERSPWYAAGLIGQYPVLRISSLNGIQLQ